MPGSIITGWASDRFDLSIVILVSTLCSALSTFFLWGFAKSLGMLIPYAVRLSHEITLWRSLNCGISCSTESALEGACDAVAM